MSFFMGMVWWAVGSICFAIGKGTYKPSLMISGPLIIVLTFFIEDPLYLSLTCLGILAAGWYIGKNE